MKPEDPNGATARLTSVGAGAPDAHEWADEAYLLMADLEGPDAAEAAREFARRKEGRSV
jgi:hypothetical protein